MAAMTYPKCFYTAAGPVLVNAGEEEPGEGYFDTPAEAGIRPCTDGNGRLWYEPVEKTAQEPPAPVPASQVQADPETPAGEPHLPQLDHDHDGAPGGSLPVDEPDGEKADLIARIAAVAKRPHPATSIEKLRAKAADLGV
jgi:hypothetical protein